MIQIFGAEDKRKWLQGAEVVGDKRYVNEKDHYIAADGSPGISTAISWVDSGGTTHTITVKNGLITEYTAI